MRVSFVTFLAFLAVATLPRTGVRGAHIDKSGSSGTGLTIIVRERAPRYKGSRGLVAPPDDGTVAVSLPSDCSLLKCAEDSNIYAWGRVLSKGKCEYKCPIETTNNLAKDDDDDDDGGSGTGLTIIVRERAPRYKGSRGLVVPPNSEYPYEFPSLPSEECIAGNSDDGGSVDGGSVDSSSSCCSYDEPCCFLLKCAEKSNFYAWGVYDPKNEKCVHECPASDDKGDDRDSEQNSKSEPKSKSKLAVGGAGMSIFGILFFMRRRKRVLQKEAVENPEDVVDAVDAVDQTEV